MPPSQLRAVYSVSIRTLEAFFELEQAVVGRPSLNRARIIAIHDGGPSDVSYAITEAELHELPGAKYIA